MFKQFPEHITAGTFQEPIYQTIRFREGQYEGLSITVKRLDLIHPEINGNKWYKLKNNLVVALGMAQPRILTFGGNHSNHIYSTASAGALFGIETIGIIRGDQESSSPTMHHARARGMHLHYIGRSEYLHKTESPFLNTLAQQFGPFHLVPEGGSNKEGILGCREILSDADRDFDIICTSCGTGATAAGLLLGSHSHQQILGFSALKNGGFLEDEILHHLHLAGPLLNKEVDPIKRMNIITDYHFGGYARWDSRLIEFILKMESEYDLPLDQVYTGKMLFGLMDMLSTGRIERNKNILCLHTGGLQGRLPQLISS